MAAIISGFQHFIQAIFELVQGVVSTITWVITSTFELVFGAVANIAGLFEHVVAFLLQNIVIIVVLVGLAFAFLTYQARQGKSVGGKKTL